MSAPGRPAGTFRLSVLIPVYNEVTSIREVLERVSRVPVEKEIIVVDDCSTDGTDRVLAGLDLPGLKVIRHETNRGKGAALRTALKAATGDAIIFQDADLEYYPEDYPALLEPILSGRAQVVYGYRDLSTQRPMMRWGNRFLTWLTNLLYGSRLRDMETCYKVLSREVYSRLTIESNRFEIEPEITAKVLRWGYEIFEVPIRYSPRGEKKLSPWRDGLPALLTLLKYRFRPV